METFSDIGALLPDSLRPYVYTPFRATDSIRLMELLPGEQGSTLRCNLVQVRRSSKVDYKALSYAWGVPIFSRTLIEVATRSVTSISESLHDALEALRDKVQNKMLWVDAVCIAQSSIEEKNHQVRQMVNIYSEARNVIVWIGNVKSLNVFKMLAGVAERPFPSEYDIGGNSIHRSTELLRPVGLGTTELDEVENFFSLPWFTRVWIVQEFALAKQPCIHVGRAVMTYSEFQRAVRNLRDDLHRTGVTSQQYPSICCTIILVELRESYKPEVNRDSQETKLPDSITWGPEVHGCSAVNIGRQCTDERDRFYAFLGLIPHVTGIVPAYGLSILRIRLNVTMKCLLSKDLSILDYAEGFEDTTEQNVAPSFLVLLPHKEDKRAGSRPDPFKSSGMSWNVGGCEEATVSDTGINTISIQGTELDEIASLLFFVKSGGVHKLTTDEMLLSQPGYSPADSTSLNLVQLNDYLFHAGLRTRKHVAHEEPDEQDALVTEQVYWYYKGFDAPKQHRRDARKALNQRICFTTKLGLYGFCSKWTRPGDRIVTFDGRKKMFVLRPSTHENELGSWKLIGDCCFGQLDEPDQPRAEISYRDNGTATFSAYEANGKVHEKELTGERFVLC